MEQTTVVNKAVASVIDSKASKEDIVTTLTACKDMIHETNDLMRDFVVTSCKNTYSHSEMYTQRYFLQSAPVYLKEYFGTIYNKLNWFQKLLWKMSGLTATMRALQEKENQND